MTTESEMIMNIAGRLACKRMDLMGCGPLSPEIVRLCLAEAMLFKREWGIIASGSGLNGNLEKHIAENSSEVLARIQEKRLEARWPAGEEAPPRDRL